MLLVVVLFLITASQAKKSRIHEDRKGVLPLPSPDETFINTMVTPNSWQRPVPFGHIFRDGFEEPNARQKQPIDPLEFDTVYLKDSHIARDVIEKLKMDYQPILPPEKIQQMHDLRFNQSERNLHRDLIPVPKPRTNESLSYWNLARMQQRNMFNPPTHARKLNYQKDKAPVPEDTRSRTKPEFKGKEKYFSKKGFYLDDSRNNKTYNFTNCDEFGRNALFHPNDIVEIDWVPFFIWTTELAGRLMTAKIHKFSHPTQNQVRNYSDEFKHHLNKTLDWDQPKLVMRQESMLEMLLIAADRRGLFDAIPYTQLPEHYKKSAVTLPLLSIRFKILDPYLAMMYCDENYATIMAVADSVPRRPKDKVVKAGIAKIVGPGYVVERDENTEAMFANALNREKLMMQQEKFISSADQREAERPMNKPIII